MATKPWPKCEAPLCEAEADESINASGDNGEFHGKLCALHAAAFHSCFAASFLQTARLRPIMVEDLLRGMAEGG